MSRVVLLGGVGVPRLSRGDVVRGESSVADEVGSESDGLGCACVHCGRVVSEPVWLTDLSCKPREETYYACPFCFSRVEIDEVLGESASASRDKSDGKVGGDKKVAVAECLHKFGYLKSRSKGSEIPDECLTCPKILQCMSSA